MPVSKQLEVVDSSVLLFYFQLAAQWGRGIDKQQDVDGRLSAIQGAVVDPASLVRTTFGTLHDPTKTPSNLDRVFVSRIAYRHVPDLQVTLNPHVPLSRRIDLRSDFSEKETEVERQTKHPVLLGAAEAVQRPIV